MPRELDFVVYSWLAGVLIACVLGCEMLLTLRAGSWRAQIDWAWVRRGLRVALPFLIGTLSRRAIFTVDRYWLAEQAGKEILGPYVLFMGIAMTLFSFLEAAVYSFLYPQLVSAWHRKDADEFQLLMRRLLMQTLMTIGAFSVASLLLIHPVLVWIDRPQYLQLLSIYPVVLLATGFLSMAMVPHYGLYARANHDHLVVLISDFDGANEETQRLATLIAAHNDMLAVAIYDPLGASMQPQPGMFVEVGGERVSLPLEARFPAAFQRAFSQRLDEWTGIFRALQVPVIPISTAEPPADQLRSLFGQHPAIR